MEGPRLAFSDDDLMVLIRICAPETPDSQRMIRVLREDEEILEGMLSDEKVFTRLIDDPVSILRVSPTLFFAILLARVKADMQRQPWTLERSRRLSLALFDSAQVVKLLESRPLRDYLTDLLVSFVRISSYSTAVRVKPGVWRRIRFSDFDIDSLARYGSAIDESQRFPVYKRIADICLFTLGIFSAADEEAAVAAPPGRQGMRMSLRRSRQDYVVQGTAFYRLASRHPEAAASSLSDVLATLSEKFTLAVKPLAIMSSRYLEPFKENVFLQ